jgi:hypothetical protein
MENLFTAIEDAVRQKNWYGVLALSLTLPDVCGRFAYPTMSADKHRYIKWFNENLSSVYTQTVGPAHTSHIFLAGDDCYALRCSLLHNGSDDKARVLLERFMFVPPPSQGSIHRNQFNSTLQLQVDKFGLEFVAAARAWWSGLADETRKNADKSMIKIIWPDDGAFSARGHGQA